MTQASRLYSAIRKAGKRGLTYLELNLLGVSVSPHKRLAESTDGLQPGERLERGQRDGRVVFRVVR